MPSIGDNTKILASSNLTIASSGTTSDALDVQGNVLTGMIVPAMTGTTLTFSVSGTDSNLVSIDASSGELVFNTAPDYENPIDSGSDNTYVISIAANDGTTSTTQSITVTVADVDEDSSTNATDIFISEYAEGSSNNKYIEIFKDLSY